MSGSQVEMQALRAAFERGEDPLVHVQDASDINSVRVSAGPPRERPALGSFIAMPFFLNK